MEFETCERESAVVIRQDIVVRLMTTKSSVQD